MVKDLDEYYENKFRHLNQDFKDITTEWQMRKIGDRYEINDHKDLEYDFMVLDKLDELHKRLNSIKVNLLSILPECEEYFLRLNKAKKRVDDLEYAYFTGTDVDSYHMVWFELHDYLIKKMGKEREEDEL